MPGKVTSTISTAGSARRSSSDGATDGIPNSSAHACAASGLLDRLLCHPESAAAAAIFRALLWEILGLLEAPSTRTSPSPHRETTILRYLRDAFDRPINRETVAASFNLSPGYLGRLIRQSTGRSFQDVLMSFRLERARWLLRHSELPINEIALRCGFNSANYFTRAFRKAFRRSPREWRGGVEAD